MLLKVGELAKSTGLTVRALHHYDNIGLLKPSGRSESGYRLYNQSDVARLHGIQALRRLGLPLSDISSLFEEGTATLPLIISRQIQALEEEMARAAELRSRLILIQDRLASGINPEIEEWLSTLGLMTTYQKYFSADELRGVFERWNQLTGEWKPLIADIRHAMAKKISPEAIEAQALARRWIDLSLRWMEGDLALLKRWDNMRREAPAAYGNNGVDAPLFEYIGKAVKLRMEALHRYLAPSQMSRLKQVPHQEWASIGNAVERLMQQRVPPHSERAKRLANRWSTLVDHLADGDPEIRERLLLAIQNEPILQAGIGISPKARQYIRDAHAALLSDPDGHTAKMLPATA